MLIWGIGSSWLPQWYQWLASVPAKRMPPRCLVVQCADTEARFRAGIRSTVSSSSAPTPLTSIRHAVFRTTAALRGPPINWV